MVVEGTGGVGRGLWGNGNKRLTGRGAPTSRERPREEGRHERGERLRTIRQNSADGDDGAAGRVRRSPRKDA